MTKALIDLPIGPGVYTEQTERGAVGRWRYADKVRFRKGLPEKIGGWIRLQPQFLGTCRRIKDWSSLDGRTWSALGTEKKLYLWQDNNLYDITPIRDSGTLGTDPFATTSGSSIVAVTHSNHGAQAGDYVRFSGATVVGGLTVSGEYSIATVPTQDTYTIVDDETANANATGGGSAVAYEYDISTGVDTVVSAIGWNAGRYGQDRTGYSTPLTGSANTLLIPIRTWSLDNWGEDLLACPRGGQIYWWDRSEGAGTRAVALDDAPQNNEAVIISQRDRHVIALGAYDYFNEAVDPLLIRWSSTEDLNDWIPTSTNTSGDLRLYSGSKIVTGLRSRLELIVFTDVSVHTLPFVGGFDVFGLNIVGENVSILGPNCAVAVDSRVFFMAEADFYIYDGIVRVLNCDVRNYVYDNLNVEQKDKIYGGLNREFNEIWWHYPSYDPDTWVQDTFELGLPPDYSIAATSTLGVAGYVYNFAPSGFTERVPTADNGYEHDFFLTNADPILTPTQSEYGVEMDVSPDIGAGTGSAGLSFLRTNVTGTPNTDADDCNQWMVELDYDGQLVRVLKKEGAVPTNPDNLVSNTVDFTTLTGSAMTTGQKYLVVAQFDTPQITVWVDGNQAFQFDMSAAELALFTSGTAGLHASPDTTGDQYRFYNFASGPVGTVSAPDFDISPIENNRYVAFNYEENTWTVGKMTRTAWADRSPLLEKAYAAGTDGYLYQHETGTDDNGAAMPSFIESFDFEIPQAGEDLMHVDQLVPDFLRLEGQVDLYLSGRKYPQDGNRITKGPYPVTTGVRKISTRLRARQVALRIESNTLGDRWRMGTIRGRVRAHGKRG